ncbi:hypothetical protein FQA39_LY05278 [Lamprigera yunnana]|nr:hypothetical protein FQA39_LY05278 [Lamprigera yunnana]
MDIHKQVGELRLMSKFDLQWLPPSYLKRNTKSTEITEAWEKLPLDIRNNEEMMTYLLCEKHWSLPSGECHLDGPPPQKRKCVQYTMFRINESGLLVEQMPSTWETFVVCPYDPKHTVLWTNLVKHKYKTHKKQCEEDLTASSAWYAEDAETMRRIAEVSKVIGAIEYWD